MNSQNKKTGPSFLYSFLGWTMLIAPLLIAALILQVEIKQQDFGAQYSLTHPLQTWRTISKNLKSFATKSKLHELNAWIPLSFSSLVDHDQTSSGPRCKGQQLHYMKKVLDVFKDNAEAHLIAGTCFYQNANIPKARHHWEMAASISPGSFWVNYNLAIDAFHRNDLSQAKEHMLAALAVPPDFLMKALLSSQIFRQVLSLTKTGLKPEKLQTRLKEHYHTGSLFIIESHLKLKEYEQLRTFTQWAANNAYLSRAEFLFYQGRSLYEEGLYQPAVSFLMESFSLEPDNGDTLKHLIACAKALENVEMFVRFTQISEKIKIQRRFLRESFFPIAL